MAPSSSARSSSDIEEVDPREVHDGEQRPNGAVIVDVREQHEFEEAPPARRHPRAARLPRDAHRGRRAGQDQRVILYCPSGNRSALAAHTMREVLGYEDVASMTGGITLWKDRGYEVEVPRALTAEQRERYSRHILIPEIGLEGQMKLLDAKVLLLGAGGLGSPIALYLAAAGVGTLGIVDDDVVDLSNLQRQVAHTNERIGMPKVDSAEIAIKEHQPRRQRRQVRDAPRRLEHHGDHRGLRRDRRRRGQLPHALPPQRRNRAAADPGRVGLDPRLRGPALGLPSLRGPLLPLPLPDAAAGRARAVVRRQRRARRAARR